MKFLVTGGAGFIGSRLADRLISDGHSIVAVDDLSTGHVENISALGSNDDLPLSRDRFLTRK